MDIVWVIVSCLIYIALYLIIELWCNGNKHNETDKKGLKKNGSEGGDDKNKDRLPPSQK